jgi:hypothetical protein
MSAIPTIVTIAVIVSRYVRTLAPIWDRIPAPWRWVPPVVVAACGLVVDRLGAAPDPVAAFDVVFQVTVLVALAATGGAHAPEDS